MSRTRGSTRAEHVGLAGALVGVVGEPGGDQRGRELVRPEAAIGAPLSCGWPERVAAKHSSRTGSRTTPDQRPVGILARDADRELGNAEQEVDRPVERVDHPAQLAVAASGRPPRRGSRRRAGGRRARRGSPPRRPGRPRTRGRSGVLLARICRLVVPEARRAARRPRRGRPRARRRAARAPAADSLTGPVVHDRAGRPRRAPWDHPRADEHGGHSRRAGRVRRPRRRHRRRAPRRAVARAASSRGPAPGDASRRSGAGPTGRWRTPGTRRSRVAGSLVSVASPRSAGR